MSAPRDYYGLLGVGKDATSEELKRAYRKLARQLHPDVNPDPAAAEQFKEVTAAYEVLSDPEKRRIVDLGGDPLSQGGGGAGDGFGGFGFGDVFEAFFGAGTGGAGRGRRSRVRPGADALLGMSLTMQQAAFGVQREVQVETAVLCESCHGDGCAAGTSPQTCSVCGGSGQVQSVQRSFLGQVMTTRACTACAGTGEQIPSPCPACHGDGRVKARRAITVDVPAGVEDGMRIRLAGQGEIGPGGGPAGDLYIEVHQQPHAVFSRDGADLHCEISLPMTQAALGTELVIELLDGSEEKVDVRAGTQSGQVLTLRGKGAPRLRSSQRGDVHVHLAVLTPTRLSDEQERLLRELAGLRHEDIAEVTKREGGLFGKVRDAFR